MEYDRAVRKSSPRHLDYPHHTKLSTSLISGPLHNVNLDDVSFVNPSS
jgi:hypothetical protein